VQVIVRAIAASIAWSVALTVLPASTAAEAATIHDVDFANFTYDLHGPRSNMPLPRSGKVVVRGGSWQDGQRTATYMNVAEVVFGDFDDDGNDEAAVRLEGFDVVLVASFVLVYAMWGAAPTLLDSRVGDRGWLWHVAARAGRLRIDDARMLDEPEFVIHSWYHVAHGRLITDSEERFLLTTSGRVAFNPNFNGAWVQWQEDSPSAFFDADAGDRLHVEIDDLVSGVAVHGRAGVIATFRHTGEYDLALPASGRYRLVALPPPRNPFYVNGYTLTIKRLQAPRTE
jgi:hypothetical protein